MTSKETSQIFATYTQEKLPDHLADKQYTRTEMNLYNKIKPTNEESTITLKTLKKTATQFKSFKRILDQETESKRKDVSQELQSDLSDMKDKRAIKRQEKKVENDKQYDIHQLFNPAAIKYEDNY